ncbi:MAG: uroporphyrinogen decarboxylase [Planctomycetes bacterium]|nr:uroporphyrinogen decarboxylase [Planctomycetota bacterium]
MTDPQWELLLRIINGERLERPAVGFLVDGPWVAGINGIDLMDYFTDGRLWLEANLTAVRQFPDVLWLPGFWAEFGMISNPPSFGTKCIWPEKGFPTCEPVIGSLDQIDSLKRPNVRTDGLLPFLLRRMKQNQEAIEQAGHRIRFATSHGPLTIASYLVGHTEFLMGLRTDREACHRLIGLVTDFICDWLAVQKETFASIDGILVLEDLMGFIGEDDFREFALPYAQRIFAALDVSVRFLHNDAYGLVTARYLKQMNVNLFNFSFEHPIDEVRRLAGEEVTLMGNVPPRDVLAQGSCDDIQRSVTELLHRVPDTRRLIVSAGGFTPPQFTSEKIAAFCQAVAGEV